MMKKNKLMIWGIALVLAIVFVLPYGPVNAAKRRYVSIAAGWVTGAYFPMAGAISRIAWKHLKEDGIKVTAESSGASVANSPHRNSFGACSVSHAKPFKYPAARS